MGEDYHGLGNEEIPTLLGRFHADVEYMSDKLFIQSINEVSCKYLVRNDTNYPMLCVHHDGHNGRRSNRAMHGRNIVPRRLDDVQANSVCYLL